MSKWDISHDDADLSCDTRASIMDVIMAADGAPLTPNQIQRRLAEHHNKDVSLKEIDVTLHWMTNQPHTELERYGQHVIRADRLTLKHNVWTTRPEMPR